MNTPSSTPGSTVTLPTPLVHDVWKKAYGEPFPSGHDSPFNWLQRDGPGESGNTHLEVSGFADACASIFDVSRQSAVLLVATLVAGVAGRTLLMPGSGISTPFWQAACVDGPDGNVARLCHELVRPVEGAVAGILQRAGESDRQALAQREFNAGTALEKVRQQLRHIREAVAVGRKAMPPLPQDIAAVEVHDGQRRLVREEARLQLDLAQIRFLKRPQLFCGLIGASEVKDRRDHGFDSSLMEIVPGGGLAGRLATTPRRILEIVRAWRIPGPVPRAMLCNAGRLDNTPQLSSLWITGEQDLREIEHSARLAPLHMLAPFLMFESGAGPAGGSMARGLWDSWWATLSGVFEDRLLERRHLFILDPGATKIAAAWRGIIADRSLSATVTANSAIRGLPEQLAIVFRRLGDARSVAKHTITAQDMELAMEVAETALKSTVTIRLRLWRATKHLVDVADEEIDGILVKLARLGPSTLRALTRTYHHITKKDLVARLDKAVGAGLVVETPDGLWILRSHLATGCQPVSASATSQP